MTVCIVSDSDFCTGIWFQFNYVSVDHGCRLLIVIHISKNEKVFWVAFDFAQPSLISILEITNFRVAQLLPHPPSSSVIGTSSFMHGTSI